MPVSVHNANEVLKLKRGRLFEVSTLFGHCSRKNTVFDYFFHKLTKRIISESNTAGRTGPKCCLTIRSTGINLQLAVPVRYKAATVLQFWMFFAFFCFLRSRRQRAFLNLGERYAHQIFGTSVYFSGDYGNVTNFWLGFRIQWPDPQRQSGLTKN